ncbi:hypothetical protein R1sor_016255 [Riccia sorocarpa]|uniref:Uncharacterized protein n=1 Tax=Riccia sorocarpa TaxID=122646 RepID=A0ABD3HGH7_9MARC
MGNVAICLVGKKAVRVVRPDGVVEELDYKMEVSELMHQYDGYMVVHCSSSGNSLGQRSKISIMSPEEKLVPGQAYVLYPIPAEFRQSFIKHLHPPTTTEPDNSTQTNASPTEDENEKSQKMKRRKKAPSMQGVILCLTRFLKGGSRVNDGSSPLLDSSSSNEESEDSSQTLGNNRERYHPFAIDPYGWRPALEDIPESPFGYHDMPQSPFSFDFANGTSKSAPQSPRPQVPLGLGLENDVHPFSVQDQTAMVARLQQTSPGENGVKANSISYRVRNCRIEENTSSGLKRTKSWELILDENLKSDSRLGAVLCKWSSK